MDDIEASIGKQPKDKETLNILMQLGLEVSLLLFFYFTPILLFHL